MNFHPMPRPRKIMSAAHKEYLLAHHSKLTNKRMADALHVGETKIAVWLAELGINKRLG